MRIRELGGRNLSGSELSPRSRSPPATCTFFLVTLDFCKLDAASAVTPFLAPSGQDVPLL